MRILVVQLNASDHRSQGEDLLAQEYPDAERLYVSDPNDLVLALDEEQLDLVLVESRPSWMRASELLRLIQDRRPGLAVILMTPERSEKQAALEQELHYSQSIIDSLLNTPTDFILIIDPQHRVITANQAFYQLSGKRAEEVRGRDMFEILPPDLAERRDAALSQVFETGETLRFEDRGVEAWLDITIYPIRDPQGQITHVVAYAHDLTKRKALEDGLRQSHQTIDALLNTPTDVITLLDREGKIIRVNQIFCQSLGISQEEALGRNLFEMLPPDLAQARKAIVQQVFESGEMVRYEERGMAGWSDNCVYPILNDQNQVDYVAVVARDITNRKQLEEILRRDQRTMQAMANAPSDIFVLLDLEGNILRTNEVMARSLGWREDELIGKCFWDLLPKPAADFRRAVFERVVQTGMSERVEDQGRLGSYDSRVIPVADDQGQVVQVAILARDITERKRIELALKESEERYRALVETSPDGIIYFDLDEGMQGRLQIVNQHFAALFGYENAEEMLNLNLAESDLIAEQDHSWLREIIQSGLQQGYVRDVNITARRKNGSVFQLEANGSMVYGPHGKPQGFLAICRDVTKRRRIELALKESEERYRTLIQTSPDGIALQDLEGRLVFVNPQFATLFGYETPEEIYQLRIKGSDLIEEQDHPKREEAMTTAFQKGLMREVTFTARRKDGSSFQLEVNGSLIHDSQGQAAGFIAICRDITERIYIQEALVKAHEHLEHRVIERTAELQAMNRQLRKEIYLRKQAEEQWRRQAQRAEALAQIASSANAQLGLKVILEAICREITRVMPFPISCVSLYRPQNDAFVIDAYASQVEIAIERVPPIPRALFEEYLNAHGPIFVIPDINALPLGSELMIAASPAIRTLASIPLYDEGELIGILSVASVDEIFIPSDDELNLLQAIANQASLAIANARLFERVSEGQASLKILTERLVAVQEDEIRNVARELHDEIGQMLTSLSLNLEIISRSIEAGEEKSSLQKSMESIRAQVKQLLNQVRDLSLNLLPAMLDDLGLLPALLDHCQRYIAQTGIQVNLAHHGLEGRFPARVETAAYRIIQEALTNVARHAEVKQVDVRLWATPNELGVQIEDQGAGFDLQQVENARRSSGISGMRERAANCGGYLDIETMPGQGTCLTAEFPFDHFIQTGGRDEYIYSNH